MSTTKTPLEITEDILKNTNALFEIHGIYKGLFSALNINDESAKNEIIKALAHRLNTVSVYASNVYWSASDLKEVLTKGLEKALEAEGDDLEEDLPFVTPDGGDAE